MKQIKDNPKEIWVKIPSDDTIAFYKAVKKFKPKRGIKSILHDTPFCKISESIYNQLCVITLAKNYTEEEQNEEYKYINNQIKIANLLRRCKFGTDENNTKVLINNQIFPIPKQIMQEFIRSLEELYKQNELNKEYLSYDEAKAIIFDDTVISDDRIDDFASTIFDLSVSDMKMVYSESDIVNEYIVYHGEIERDITEQQIKDTIRRLEHSLNYNSPKVGRKTKDIRIHCAIQIFTKSDVYKHIMQQNKGERLYSNNNIYWWIFQCLDYMDFFTTEEKNSWGGRKGAQVSYIKSMCTNYSDTYDLHYIKEDEIEDN